MATKKKKEDGLVEPKFSITKNQINWLCAALSTDPRRKVLNVARLDFRDGVAYLVTTDTHRVHVVRIEAQIDCPSCFIDLRRLSNELKFAKGHIVSFDKDMEPSILDRDGLPISKVFAPILNTVEGGFVSWQLAVPDYKLIDEPVRFFSAFNFKYISDMRLIACDYSSRVHFMGSAPTRPWVMSHMAGNPWKSEWFAVVMPMQLSESAK